MTPPGESDAVFDPAALERLQQLDPQGRKQLLPRVMAAFEASLHKTQRELSAARGGADTGALRTLAHTLKSSAGSMGARDLAQACAELEALARQALDGAGSQAVGAPSAALATAQDRLTHELDRALQALPALQRDPVAGEAGGVAR